MASAFLVHFGNIQVKLKETWRWSFTKIEIHQKANNIDYKRRT